MTEGPAKEGKSPAPANRQEILLTFDGNVFNLAAIKKAAYRYMQLFVVDISTHEGEVRCVLRFRPPVTESTCDRLVDEFKKEVLDQDLRERLKVETEPVRNLILAHAFSRSGLIDEQVSED